MSSLKFVKEVTIAENGIVCAKHHLAAEAGIEMLKKGGNAVDAAVATGFALTVVEPYNTQLGGPGGFMIIYKSGSKSVEIIDYNTIAPGRAKPDMYELVPEPGPFTSVHVFPGGYIKNDANEVGYRAVSIPGIVAGLCKALERHGTMSLEEVMSPAIKHAEEGFEVNWYISLMMGRELARLSLFPATMNIFLKDAHPYKPGERWVQKDLARTLKKIACCGADAFYKGEIARTIAEDMEKHGGLLTEDDLARFKARIVEPKPGTYRGYEVYYVPLNSGGPTMMEELNIIEGFDISKMGHNTSETLHIIAETLLLAFADRFEFIGDPEYEKTPMKGLLTKEYAAEVRKQIDLKKSMAKIKPRDPWRYEPEGCTTHLCVIDKERNMVSNTQTLGSAFGSGVVIPGTGIMMNNNMHWFDPEPGKANSIRPYKKPLANMTPALLLRGEEPFMSVGAPGGRRIHPRILQVIINVIDFNMNMQEAISAPPIYRDHLHEEVIVDSRIPEKTCNALRKMGHKVVVVKETPGRSNFAKPMGILIEPKTGKLQGGVDLFDLGVALGY